MRLDSVRELKHQVLTGQVPPPAAVPLDVDRPVPARGLLGIAPRVGGGYRLAVRLTAEDESLRPWVAALANRARSEVDVRVVGHVAALGSSPQGSPAEPGLRARHRPLRPGLSIGHPRASAGTLGGFVVRPDQPRPLVLSNSHVLAPAGAGAGGDPVYQPGPADGGTAADRVGALLLQVPLHERSPNVVDAALAVLDDDIGVGWHAGAGAPARVWDGDPRRLLHGVRKLGRTTGLTSGRVTAFEVDAVPVGYGDGRVLVFDDQLEIEGTSGAFSSGGDSGALVCADGGRLAAGLLFAASVTGGTAAAGLTYANPLPAVLEAVGAELLTS